jgi:hypothetical protein
MIPKIIHFIFGLSEDPSKREFSFYHFLAIKTAAKVNEDYKIIVHFCFEPKSYWWSEVKKFVELNNVTTKKEIFNNQLSHYAHRSDVLRLEILKQYGGVYLDIDVISINSFDQLLKYEFVMGREENNGLCNAVILANKNSQFLNLWYKEYKNFDEKFWNYHSVQLPHKIAKTNPELIRVLSEYSFFYPMYCEIASNYLWQQNKIRFTYKLYDILQKIRTIYRIRNNHVSINFITHSFRSFKWHQKKMGNSFCIHLWESVWGKEHLKNITPEWLLSSSGILANLIVNILGYDYIADLKKELDSCQN